MDMPRALAAYRDVAYPYIRVADPEWLAARIREERNRVSSP
jgi:hypothetical protein